MGIFAWLKFMVQVFAISIWRFLKSIFTESRSRVYKMKSGFNESEASFIHKTGKSSIVGQAYLQRKDGSRWTASGHYSNKLIPATRYAQERMIAKFKNDQAGYIPLGGSDWPIIIEGDEAKYNEYTKEASVDSNGNFEFKNISAGSYYVLSFVRQGINDRLVGGDLMQRVTVAEQETKTILMVKND